MACRGRGTRDRWPLAVCLVWRTSGHTASAIRGLVTPAPSAGADAPAPVAGRPPAVHYVGSQACATCHAPAYEAWRSSHHTLAMQEATAQTVLGNFHDAHFTAAGLTSTFFTRDGKFYVNTDGPDGALHDYEITYTFGVYAAATVSGRVARWPPAGVVDRLGHAPTGGGWPALVPPLPGRDARGRRTRCTGQGGSRPGTTSALSATRPTCGSTTTPRQNRYATTWAEIDGVMRGLPRAWRGPCGLGAGAPAPRRTTRPARAGLVVRLGRGAGSWVVQDPQRGIATWQRTAALDCAKWRRVPAATPGGAHCGPIPLWPPLPRYAYAGPPRRRALPRRWPDPGRGL